MLSIGLTVVAALVDVGGSRVCATFSEAEAVGLGSSSFLLSYRPQADETRGRKSMAPMLEDCCSKDNSW